MNQIKRLYLFFALLIGFSTVQAGQFSFFNRINPWEYIKQHPKVTVATIGGTAAAYFLYKKLVDYRGTHISKIYGTAIVTFQPYVSKSYQRLIIDSYFQAILGYYIKKDVLNPNTHVRTVTLGPSFEFPTGGTIQPPSFKPISSDFPSPSQYRHHPIEFPAGGTIQPPSFKPISSDFPSPSQYRHHPIEFPAGGTIQPPRLPTISEE